MFKCFSLWNHNSASLVLHQLTLYVQMALNANSLLKSIWLQQILCLLINSIGSFVGEFNMSLTRNVIDVFICLSIYLSVNIIYYWYNTIYININNDICINFFNFLEYSDGLVSSVISSLIVIFTVILFLISGMEYINEFSNKKFSW
jgi:hypothetical protein